MILKGVDFNNNIHKDLKDKLNDNWKEQYFRVRRWYEKTQKIDPERSSISLDELDILYAFFQNCWSLHDWLINSLKDRKPNSKNDNPPEIELFFNGNNMNLCYDICMGSKHLKMFEHKVRISYTHPNIAHEYTDQGETFTQIIKYKKGTCSMVNLAKSCMNEVEEFLFTMHLNIQD